MADPDFEALLQQDMDDIEAPKPLPAGEYVTIVKSHETGKSSRKETPYVRFFLQPTEAGEDVDTEMLPDNWREKSLRATFYLTENSMFRLKNFLGETLGLDVSGKSLREVIPEAHGMQCVATVTVQATENGEFNPDVDRTAPVE